MLAGAALAALRLRERPELGSAVAGAALLALLPWLGPKFLLPAAPVAIALVRWTARRGRRTAALAAAEIMVASLVVCATINDRLYGGLVPSAVAASGEPPTGASSVADYVDRVPRLAALWIDRDAGLLRWAPVLGLCLYAIWLLWRRGARTSPAWWPSAATPRPPRSSACSCARACSPWRRSPPRR